jgi:ABC-2 type transport system ATP-binding protein
VLGKPADLIREIGEDVASIRIQDKTRAKEFTELPFVRKVEPGETINLILDDGPNAVPKLFEFAAKNGIRILSLEVRTPTLNDVFLHHVGRELRPESGDGRIHTHMMMRRRGTR